VSVLSDVIDWILDNLVDKTRNRRTVLKKLKELGLLFKAPTKRSTKSAQSGKNVWQPEEDDELRSLYDQHRIEPGKWTISLSTQSKGCNVGLETRAQN